MNIIYLHQHYRTPEMGGGTRSYEFTRRLAARGHNVDVITADPRGQAGTWRVTHRAGVDVHWCGVGYDNTMSYRRRITAFADFAWRSMVRANGLPQDLVFATSTPLTVAIPAMYSARRNKVPWVFEVRDLWPGVAIAMGALKPAPLRTAARALEARAYPSARHVIALSPDMATDINLRFPQVPTTVIPNSCDTDIFAHVDGAAVRARTPWLGSRPLILYAGTLGKVNGVGYLVRMAYAVARSRHDVRFAIIGDGAQEPVVRQLATELKVLDRTLFMMPAMPKQDVAEWFAAADVGVSTVIDRPGLGANSANKVFDTWAAGRPVAINHGGWLADIIQSTGAGLLLPANEPGEAAQRLLDFLADRQRVDNARKAASDLAYGDFSRGHLFDRWESVLLDAAGR